MQVYVMLETEQLLPSLRLSIQGVELDWLARISNMCLSRSINSYLHT